MLFQKSKGSEVLIGSFMGWHVHGFAFSGLVLVHCQTLPASGFRPCLFYEHLHKLVPAPSVESTFAVLQESAFFSTTKMGNSGPAN